jgi:hypothetical protein
MKRGSSQLRKSWFLAALLASGLLLVRAGALPLWLWALLTALAVATRLLPRIDPYRDELLVSDEGLTRQHGSKLRKTSIESVRWDALSEVEVLANETGPDRKDLLFLLRGSDGQGVAVPGPVAQGHGLVAVLERRLAGFRRDLLQQAEVSTERRSWTLWQRQGQAAASGE